jgi:hypothetical protein
MISCAKSSADTRRVILIFMVFLMVFTFTTEVTGEETNLQKLDFKWTFPTDRDMVYNIKQHLDSQRDSYHFETQKWVTTLKRKEDISGYCVLTPAGDANALGVLYLNINEVLENGLPVLIPTQTPEGQLAAKFILNPRGGMEAISQAPVTETYIILRMLFGMPPAFIENEGKVTAFRDWTRGEPVSSLAQGTVNYEFIGFEDINEIRCAKVGCKISLLSDLEAKKLPGSTDWKGTGTIFYEVEHGRLLRSSWKIAKKTETNLGDPPVPCKIIEIFDINLELKAVMEPKSVEPEKTH